MWYGMTEDASGETVRYRPKVEKLQGLCLAQNSFLLLLQLHEQQSCRKRQQIVAGNGDFFTVPGNFVAVSGNNVAVFGD